MAEYGDPDKPEEWSFLRNYSPYHLAVSPKERKYPPSFFTTSTRDDRVHPAHARKMVNKLLQVGQPCIYYENIEGGHAGAANNEQTAFMELLGYRFLENTLGGGVNRL
jgi:prolyl oligopeptidase